MVFPKKERWVIIGRSEASTIRQKILFDNRSKRKFPGSSSFGTDKRKDKEMENYRGVVQDIIMIGDGEYRVTFRAYNEKDLEAIFRENEDVPFKLYSMIARQKENDFSLVPEGILTDCMNILNENDSIDSVQLDEIDKWKIGLLANDIASSLADDGMFVNCGEEESD